jgi:hypothetical protein
MKARLGDDLRVLLHGASDHFLLAGQGWDRRRADRLARLRLITAKASEVPLGQPTPTGKALGLLVACRMGVRLQRSGVALLSRHIRYLESRFSIDRGVDALKAERDRNAREQYESARQYAKQRVALDGGAR